MPSVETKGTPTTVVPQKINPKRTLRDLFDTDFPSTLRRKADYTILPEGNKITVTVETAYDFTAGTVFLVIYVPSSDTSSAMLLAVYRFIADSYNQFFELEKSKGIHIETKNIGDSKAMKFDEFKFSGVIYLYAQRDIDLQEKADLDKYYKSKDLRLQFRSYDYELLANR